MKVNIEVSKKHNPPYAIIYTDVVNDEILQLVDSLSNSDTPIVTYKNERMHILKPEEIYMITIEEGKTVIYTLHEKYSSKKRLYEIIELLGSGFMQISKQTVINLSYLECVEAGFNGTLLLKLKNGKSDYISRKYLPHLKKYLGL